MDWPDQLFVTGTDTGIGKTVVSAFLMAGLKGTYWKPVQSGLAEETDTECVKRLSGLEGDHFLPETYRLIEPLSPHASAEIDGVEIDMNRFALPKGLKRSPLIVEGAGGLLVPMNDREMIIDLITRLELPVLLVVRSELGTLNHTFLSLEALRRRGIPILGVIMNGPRNESNRKAIEQYGEVPVLAELTPLEVLNAKVLEEEFNRLFTT